MPPNHEGLGRLQPIDFDVAKDCWPNVATTNTLVAEEAPFDGGSTRDSLDCGQRALIKIAFFQCQVTDLQASPTIKLSVKLFV